MLGDEPSERAGRAGDHHGAAGEVGEIVPGQRVPGDPRHEDPIAAHGGLRDPRGDQVGEAVVAGGVHDGEAAGMLALRRTDQSPERGLLQSRHGVRGAGGDRAVGADHHGPVVVEQTLNGGEQARGLRVDVPVRGSEVEDHEVRGAGGHVGLHPLQGVQRRNRGGARGAGRADRQGVDVEHRQPGRVGGVQAQRLGAGRRGEPDPQGTGADRVQADAVERERQPGRVAGDETAGGQGVQAGVEESGVDAVAVDRVLDGHLGEDLPVRTPDVTQALEGGAVDEAGVGEGGVQALGVDRRGVARRPGHRRRAPGLRRGRQGSGGVLGPWLVAVGAGVDRHAAAGGDGDPQVDAARPGQRHRGLEQQLLDDRGAGPLAGGERELQHCGAGDQDRAEDVVVGEPALGTAGDVPAEHDRVRAGQQDRGGEQRVARVVESGGGQVAGGRGGGEPEVVALERVGGQVREPAALGGPGAPVDVDAADPGVAEGADLGGRAVLAAAQGSPDTRFRGALLQCQGQDRVAGDLGEQPETVLSQTLDDGGEADLLPQVVPPILRSDRLDNPLTRNR